MIKLTDALPETLVIGKRKYRMKPDFRNVLLMMKTLERTDIIPEARQYLALKCVVKHPPKDDKAVSEIMSAFKAMMLPDSGKKESGERLTSFEQDADLIRAAFRQNYGIDLFREKLHWLEFVCLLSGLPEGSRYTEIIGIRARPIPKATKYNAEERRALMKAKAAHRIEKTETEIKQNMNASIDGVAQFLLSIAKRGGEKDA